MVNAVCEGCQDPVLDEKNKSTNNNSILKPLASIDEKIESKSQSPSLYTTKIVTINWKQLHDVEYFAKGGSSIIHTAFYNGRNVIVKTINPDMDDNDKDIYTKDIENEFNLLSRLNHPNIIKVYGGGYQKGKRFLVMERLDGGILSEKQQQQASSNKFWKQKKDSSCSLSSLVDSLKHARALADAVHYCHDLAIPGCMILHRDLKPGNIGLTSDGTIKLFDFGLSRMLEGASSYSNKVYKMSGKTGSLRYMAPEVVNKHPYNYKVDVYSFGIILWELLSNKRSFLGMTEDEFMTDVVCGAKRPSPINKNWPKKLIELMNTCWDVDGTQRPTFSKIVHVLDTILIDIEKIIANNGSSANNSGSDSRPRLMRRNSLPARLVLKGKSSLSSLERKFSFETSSIKKE